MYLEGKSKENLKELDLRVKKNKDDAIIKWIGSLLFCFLIKDNWEGEYQWMLA
jgi:hypothetical protein